MKTTKKQFNEYKNEVLRLAAKCGVGDWSIYFEHRHIKEHPHWVACFGHNEDLTSAIFTLNTDVDLGTATTLNIDMKETARHEFGHLLVARLTELANCRFLNPDELYKENEKFAVMMEKALR